MPRDLSLPPSDPGADEETMSCSVRGELIPPDCCSPGKGWSQTPWEHESTPPCPTHGCQDRLNHFLGVSCLSLLAGGDVQMTVSSPGAVRVTQRTEPALCNLQPRL